MTNDVNSDNSVVRLIDKVSYSVIHYGQVSFRTMLLHSIEKLGFNMINNDIKVFFKIITVFLRK